MSVLQCHSSAHIFHTLCCTAATTCFPRTTSNNCCLQLSISTVHSKLSCCMLTTKESCAAACSLLDAELVQETLDELSRLMPKSDPKQTLLRNPSWVTKVERGPKRLGPHPDSGAYFYLFSDLTECSHRNFCFLIKGWKIRATIRKLM